MALATSPAVHAAPSRNVLVVHDVLPHFDRSGSDLRILQVVRRLRALGHAVTFIGRNGVDAERYAPPLRDLGVEVFAHDAERAPTHAVVARPQWRLDDLLRARRIDVAILCHWFWSGLSVSEQYLDEVRRCSPRTRVVVLTDDRHGLRELRGAELTGRWSDHERGVDFTARELECHRAADLVAAITEDDRRGLLALDPGLRIELLPMAADAVDGAPGFDARSGFAFLADFENLANRDAFEWFCGAIWPAIRQRLPDAALRLGGSGIPASYARQPGIVRVGHVADVGTLLDAARVFVSPIRMGTGLKTKNLAALAHGIPLVTTTVGAEGMALVDGKHGMVLDDPAGFAEAAVAVHEERARWETLSSAGLDHVRAEFSIGRLDAALRRMLDRACAREPLAYDPAHRFSVRRVEDAVPRVWTAPAPARIPLRLRAYRQLAEDRMAAGRYEEALAQLRHVFGHLHGDPPASPLLARVFAAMERCYRALGDDAAAARCAAEAPPVAPPSPPLPRAASVRGPALSVVIPTFDRRETLRRCLAALAAQTLPPDQFEVVVVDDGSTDGTAELLASMVAPFRLVRVRQANAGVAAARRAGVERATGTYLLLVNDDTIADPDLLREHLRAQRELHDARPAVLGTFEYGPRARRRALTCFLDTTPFLFPQAGLAPEVWYGPTQLVTCNLSVRRDVVLAAGSFDPRFRAGEDTDLGLRLARLGCRVLFEPRARAWHDHLDMDVPQLVRRARGYGRTWLDLLARHPTLEVRPLGVPLRGAVGAAEVAQARAVLSSRRGDVDALVEWLRRQDGVDFEPMLSARERGEHAADEVLGAFAEALPIVHWFHVLEGLCETWSERHPIPSSAHHPRGRSRA